MAIEYPALFEPEPDGGYVITFPDFDWGVSHGHDEEDARSHDGIRALADYDRKTYS
jgi:hypothetical protein